MIHSQKKNNNDIWYCRGLAVPGWDSTKELITIFGIASGMLYLHFHNIIHRDFKPENVLTDDRLFPKISDFGFSKKKKKKKLKQFVNVMLKGTPSYLSPEIIESQEYVKSFKKSGGLILWLNKSLKVFFESLC